MSLPVVLNMQPCLYQEWADSPSNEEDADLSNLLQFHCYLTYQGDVVVNPFVGYGTTAVAAPEAAGAEPEVITKGKKVEEGAEAPAAEKKSEKKSEKK